MAQGLLPIEYAEVSRSGGVTALAGILPYMDLLQVSELRSSVERHLGTTRRQGWSESQLCIALLLLNLVGGESVDDVRILERDEGLGEVVRRAELHGVRRRERRARARRWRRERRLSLPSPPAVFRYLESFHDASEEDLRLPGRAFIPAPGTALRGLERVNADLVGFVQSRAPQAEATLDMDATLVETQKRTALHSYEGTRAYQPLTTYWAEAGLVVHSEFRDGNVPAGHEQLRVLDEALEHLPAGVERVLLRSDTARLPVGAAALLRRGAQRALRRGRVRGGGRCESGVQGGGGRGGRGGVERTPGRRGRDHGAGVRRGVLRPGGGRALPERSGLPVHRGPRAAAQPTIAGDGRPRAARRRAPGRGGGSGSAAW